MAKLPPELRAWYSKLGKKYGALGAAVTNEKLTREKRSRAAKKGWAKRSKKARSEHARNAVLARWKKARRGKSST